MQYNTIDEVLPVIGEFGWFQLCTMAICLTTKIPQQMQMVITYFLSLNPKWKCIGVSSANDSCLLTNETYSATNQVRCSMPRNEWTYAKPTSYSVVTYYDLACHSEWVIPMSTSITLISEAVGTVIVGVLADRYGRRPILIFSFVLMSVIALVSIWSPTVEVFLTSRALVGFFMAGVFTLVMTLSCELVGNKYRPLTGNMVGVAICFGECVLSLLAYALEDWRKLLVVSIVPFFPIVISFRWLPESTRWLLARGRREEAETILRRAATVNGKQLESKIILQSKVAAPQIEGKSIDLFFNTKSILQLLIQIYAFFAINTSYYGLSFISEQFGSGSLYFNFLYASLTGLPGAIIGYFLTRYIGRKPTAVCSMCLAGIATIGIGFIPERLQILKLVLGLFAKFCSSLVFSAILVWSPELIPTLIRATTFSILAVAGRIGGGSSPWITQGLLKYGTRVPFVSLGSITLLGGILLCFLPESKNLHIDEEERIPLLTEKKIKCNVVNT